MNAETRPARSAVSAEEERQILDAIDSEISEGQKVYVHCWGGIGRTGLGGIGHRHGRRPARAGAPGAGAGRQRRPGLRQQRRSGPAGGSAGFRRNRGP